MAKKVQQFRYYSDNHPKNYPSGTRYSDYSTGRIFSDYVPIVQLGIQTLPGTKFYLNGAEAPIIVGITGIYELNLIGLTEISSITVDPQSLALIQNNNNAYLVIDILYEDGES